MSGLVGGIFIAQILQTFFVIFGVVTYYLRGIK